MADSVPVYKPQEIVCVDAQKDSLDRFVSEQSFDVPNTNRM